MTFICPCLTCPNCGDVTDDYEHPIDGLAYCHACERPEPSPRVIEWWVYAGPYMDGRHPESQEELEEWREYDDSIWAANPLSKSNGQ